MSRFLLPLLVSLAFMAPTVNGTSAEASAERILPGETVVLLHGLGLGSWAMKRFEHALRREGYRVVNISYGSRWTPLETLAGSWLPRTLHETGADSAPRLHFVTHSMGGIVLRLWLHQQTADSPRVSVPATATAASLAGTALSMPSTRLGRVVMLAPPNAGSEVAERLRRFPPFRWFTGVNGARLGTGSDSLPRSLGPWPAGAAPLGIIAGNHSFNPLFSAWLPGPDDGKVAVASTRLDGMSDFVVLHHSHTWLQWRRETVRQTLAFLRHARFASDATQARG
jgi:pimeloyl-ACP methyl ester carboxylesterase